MRARPTRLALLLTALLATLVLAACGGGSGGDETTSPSGTSASGADAVLVAAATKASDAGSSKVKFAATTDIPGQEAPVVLTGEGEFDYAAQKGRLTYDLSDLFAAAGQDIGSEPAEIVVDGTVFYMKFPALSSLLPGAKEWIKFDLATLGKESGFDLAQLQQLNQGDPAATLEYLRATGDVEEVGQEDLDGVETTHYRATVDVDKAIEQAPAESRAALQAQIDQLKAAGLEKLPIDVWIDGDGLPRKFTYDVTVDTNGQKVRTVVEMELTDYGVEVEVTPPPADQVTDFSELASQLGATTG
jgi:hypothetical protein